jgi:titin
MMEIMDEEGFGQAAQLAARRKRRRILAEQTEEYAPFFREKLKDTAFADGKPVTLRVVVVGFPQPTVHWYHHDIPLETGAHIRYLINEDGTALLTLMPASGVDAGEYKCVARNKLGEAVCHASLHLGGMN